MTANIMSTTADAAAFPVLHRLRIVGRAPADALPGDPAALPALVADGLLGSSDRGHTLTAAGLRRHGELLAAERARVDLAELERAYERFLAVNQPIKDACAAWQARARQAGEAEVIAGLDRLEQLVERARPSLDRAARALPRFGEYARRLDTALDRAAEGDHRFLTDPRLDSVHTVWFECHEDYLLTLGRDRDVEERGH